MKISKMNAIFFATIAAAAPFVWMKGNDEYHKREMVMASSDLIQAHAWILDFNRENSMNPKTIGELLDWLRKEGMFTRTSKDIEAADRRGDLIYNQFGAGGNPMITWKNKDWLVVLNSDGSVISKWIKISKSK